MRLLHRHPRRSRRIRGRRPRGTPYLLLLRRFTAFALLITAFLLFVRPAADADSASTATVTVLVAVDDIPAGTPIAADLLSEQTIPATSAPDGSDLSLSELSGAHTLGAVRAGEILTDARITELALADGSARGLPSGLVPVVVHLTDPAVVSTLAPGMCLDLYAGEAGLPLEQVATGLYLVAIVDTPDQDPTGHATVAVTGAATRNVSFVVLGVPAVSVNSVASWSSASVVFVTVCADVVN